MVLVHLIVIHEKHVCVLTEWSNRCWPLTETEKLTICVDLKHQIGEFVFDLLSVFSYLLFHLPQVFFLLWINAPSYPVNANQQSLLSIYKPWKEITHFFQRELRISIKIKFCMKLAELTPCKVGLVKLRKYFVHAFESLVVSQRLLGEPFFLYLIHFGLLTIEHELIESIIWIFLSINLLESLFYYRLPFDYLLLFLSLF